LHPKNAARLYTFLQQAVDDLQLRGRLPNSARPADDDDGNEP
jgi:hypothetical protein